MRKSKAYVAWGRIGLAAVFAAFVAAALWAEPASAPISPTVAIVKGPDIPQMVAKAIDLSGGLKDIVHDGTHVVIKPNLTMFMKQKGVATRVEVVRAVVEQLRKTAKCRITIAEGAGEPAVNGFEGYGYTALAKEYGIPLVDLATDKRVAVKIDGLALKEYELPATIVNCDVLIDMPVLKTHVLTGVSLGMKNLFGLMPLPRSGLHDRIDGVLCDLVRIKKPALVVVDGTYGMEGKGPLYGETVQMDVILAGRDIVAVDTVATSVMGLPPEKIGHIALAVKNGLGEGDLKKITIKGEPIESVRRPFKEAPPDK
jgi:uncharacterized protein (DUF362 family)